MWHPTFRQGGWGYTTDGGVTWTFPGVLQDNVFRSDPVTNSDETGTFFYLSLLQTFCENMYQSSNGGQSWTELQPDGPREGGDKQWFTIDKTGGQGTDSNISPATGLTAAATAYNSNDLRRRGHLAGPHRYSYSPTDGTLDVDTNGNLFIGGEGFSPFYCVRSKQCAVRRSDTDLRPE